MTSRPRKVISLNMVPDDPGILSQDKTSNIYLHLSWSNRKVRIYPPPHTVTITSQNENYANISGTTGPIMLIFLVQNPYKFTKLLWKNIVHRHSHCWDNWCRRFFQNWCPDSLSYCPQCWECDVSHACAVSYACAVHSFTVAVKPVLPHT